MFFSVKFLQHTAVFNHPIPLVPKYCISMPVLDLTWYIDNCNHFQPVTYCSSPQLALKQTNLKAFNMQYNICSYSSVEGVLITKISCPQFK